LLPTPSKNALALVPVGHSANRGGFPLETSPIEAMNPSWPSESGLGEFDPFALRSIAVNRPDQFHSELASDSIGDADGPALLRLIKVPEALGASEVDRMGRPVGEGGHGSTGSDGTGPPEAGMSGCIVIRLPGYYRVDAYDEVAPIGSHESNNPVAGDSKE